MYVNNIYVYCIMHFTLHFTSLNIRMSNAYEILLSHMKKKKTYLDQTATYFFKTLVNIFKKDTFFLYLFRFRIVLSISIKGDIF